MIKIGKLENSILIYLHEKKEPVTLVELRKEFNKNYIDVFNCVNRLQEKQLVKQYFDQKGNKQVQSLL